jgi:hypothetical protein
MKVVVDKLSLLYHSEPPITYYTYTVYMQAGMEHLLE